MQEIDKTKVVDSTTQTNKQLIKCQVRSQKGARGPGPPIEMLFQGFRLNFS